MKRNYKEREKFNISCLDCSCQVATNSYRTLRCKPCAKSAEYRTNMLDFKWRLKKLLAMAKNRSKEKELPFDLTEEYLIGLWEGQQGKCIISGRDLDLNPYGSKGQVNPNAPSIDRINPKLGYVKGNVRLVVYHINVALSEFGLEAFMQLAWEVSSKG